MKVVAVVSGGMDSVCFLAQHDLDECHVLAFDYGQKGVKELSVIENVVAGFPFVQDVQIIDMSFMQELWPGSQLTDEAVDIEDNYVPTVVVPLRNMVMLTIAAAYAKSIGAGKIIFGAHADDAAGYPDCRNGFVAELQKTLNTGHPDNPLTIDSPARCGFSKAENLKRAHALVGDIIFNTWSCYRSEKLHCGVCESCRNRKKAIALAGLQDKTEYEG